MSDYIEREALLYKIRWASTVEECVMSVRRMPAADVVPASKWIKCEDKLPHFVVDVLLLFESSMAVGYLREKHGSETAWDIIDENGCGIGAHSKPLYWMPLPDTPKDV